MNEENKQLIHIVLVFDRHFDTDISLFTSYVDALKFANDIVANEVKKGNRSQEYPISNVYDNYQSFEYSCEGDRVEIHRKYLNSEV